MGRRARSGSNANNTQIVRNNAVNANLNQPRAVDNESPNPTAAGMSPGSRYNHNLKVLRRRDPSIVSIFDQFSHVCLYHYNGEKWEKKGYEGSMFLYERCVLSSKFRNPPVTCSGTKGRIPTVRVLHAQPDGDG